MVALLFTATSLKAADWNIEPRLSVVETYTDNLRLAPEGQEESELVTQINPGLSLTADGRRVRLDLDYNMQNLLYADNPSQNRTNNQFSGDLNSELIRDWFYLDLHGSLSQQLVAPQNGVATDNLNIVPGSRGDVIATSVSPQLRRNIGRDMRLVLAYTEGRVYYDGNGASDAETEQLSFTFERSREGAGVDWLLTANEHRTERHNANDYERRNAQGRIGVPLFSRELRFVAYAGYEEGQISSARDFEDGNYWSAGFFWQPSPKLSLELTKGDNDEQGRLRYAPNTRTQLSASYVSRDVGIRPSTTWVADISHRTRRSVWTLSYLEQLSSDVILALTGAEPQVLRTPTGDVVFNEQGEPIVTLIPQFDVVDEEFVRAVTTLGVSYTTGKSTINLRLTDETRDYELTRRHAELQSAYASLSWRFASRTSLSLSHLQTDIDEVNLGERQVRIETIALQRQVNEQMSTQLTWRHVEFEQNALLNDYVENRISASLTTTF